MSSSRETEAVERITTRTILLDPFIGPLIAIVFVFLTGFGLVFPVVPLFARTFGVGNDGAGLLVATFGFARLFGDLVGGTIVDRKGERWTAVFGMGLLAACSAATAASPNFAIALSFWGLAGIGSAIVFASLFSYILKAAQSDRVARTFSFFYGAFNVGVIAGGALGGLIANAYGLAAPLYAQSVVLVAAIFIYLRLVPKLPTSAHVHDRDNAPERRGLHELLRTPGFLTSLFLHLTYLWIISAILGVLVPLYASVELGMSPATIGAMFALGVLAELIVLFPAGTWSDRYGRRSVLIPALTALTIMCALLGTASSAAMLTFLLALLAFACGLAAVPPAAMLSDVVPTEHSGRGVGAFRFAGDVGYFMAPLLAGAASKAFGFQSAFAIIAVVPLAALLLTLRMKETLHRETF